MPTSAAVSSGLGFGAGGEALAPSNGAGGEQVAPVKFFAGFIV